MAHNVAWQLRLGRRGSAGSRYDSASDDEYNEYQAKAVALLVDDLACGGGATRQGEGGERERGREREEGKRERGRDWRTTWPRRSDGAPSPAPDLHRGPAPPCRQARLVPDASTRAWLAALVRGAMASLNQGADEAVSHFTAAIAIRPAHAAAYLLRARDQFQEAALESFDTGYRLSPTRTLADYDVLADFPQVATEHPWVVAPLSNGLRQSALPRAPAAVTATQPLFAAFAEPGFRGAAPTQRALRALRGTLLDGLWPPCRPPPCRPAALPPCRLPPCRPAALPPCRLPPCRLPPASTRGPT